VDTFAFIIHPINPKRDVSRKYPLLGKIFNEPQINYLSAFFPPVYLSEIEGIKSDATGKEIKGWLIACPLTPKRMMGSPEKLAYRKIIQTGRMAEKLGADILGLGAFTSVVGDGGETIARNLEIPVTNGDAYTIAVAVQAVEKAAEIMEIPINSASGAVVGASGTIGRVCAELLSKKVAELFLIGKNLSKLEELREHLESNGSVAQLHTSTSMHTLRKSQLILTVTSSIQAVIQPEHLAPGSVVCDIARPRDVSAHVAATRDDVLIIDGGMVEVPGQADFHFDFGFPPGKAYACMAETITLALEGRFEDYTLGKNIKIAQVEEIDLLARKHGFKLSGFRSFEKEVPLEYIQKVQHRAHSAIVHG
jgi:predicted amino acid dehydrogenase